MRALVQEACQGPVRDAVATHAEKLATLSEADLRPLNIRDFQVHAIVMWSHYPLPCTVRLTIWMHQDLADTIGTGKGVQSLLPAEA